MPLPLGGQETEAEAQRDESIAVLIQTKGDQLQREGRAKVGAQDHRHGLHQLHQSRVEEAQYHDDGRAAQREKAQHRTEAKADRAVAGGPIEDGAQAFSGGLPQAVGHEAHSKEKQCCPAQNGGRR